jgi:hypothetical protein
MPLPLAPLLPLALRLGAVATAGYAATRWVRARSHPGRTDQRAEDALDDLGEGLSLHQPADRVEDRQRNMGLRLRRVIRLGGRKWEIDGSLIARLRLRQGDG